MKMKHFMRITERAAEHLEDLLARYRTRDRCLRLVPGRGGFGLVLDKVRENDRVVDQDGMPILILHPILASALEDATLDYQEYPDGPRLTVIR